MHATLHRCTSYREAAAYIGLMEHVMDTLPGANKAQIRSQVWRVKCVRPFLAKRVSPAPTLYFSLFFADEQLL